MTALSPEQAAHFEKLLNEYERMREDAQEGLKTVVGELREKLSGLVAKEDLADELAGFRLFVKRRYIQENHPEKAEKADAKTQVADAYEFQASQAQVYTTHAHSAGRAKPDAREQAAALARLAGRQYSEEVIEAVADGIRARDTVGTTDATPHDPVTGEIAAFAELSTLIEKITVLDRHGAEIITKVAAPGAPVIETGTDAAAPTNHELSHGASDQADEPVMCAAIKVADEQAVELDTEATSVAPASLHPGEHHDEVAVSLHGQAQTIDTPAQSKVGAVREVPVQVHTTVDRKPLTPFYPDPTNKRVFNPAPVDDIPAQFRRAPVQGNA